MLDNATQAAPAEYSLLDASVSAATSYTLYWTSNGSTPTTGSDNITITGNTSTSYVHAGLDSTKTYNYKMVANIGSSASTLPTMAPAALQPCRVHNFRDLGG